MLTREQIEAAEDCRFEVISVPEWGGHVRVGVMSGEERDAFEAECYASRNGASLTPNIRARVAAWVLQDESGKRLFTAADVVKLGKKSGIALERVYAAAERVNGLTKAALEDLEKNSTSGQSV